MNAGSPRVRRHGERVLVEAVVAFDADVERAVGLGPRHAKQNIPVRDLAVVQRDLPALVDLAIVANTRSGRVARLDVRCEAGTYHLRGDRPVAS